MSKKELGRGLSGAWLAWDRRQMRAASGAPEELGCVPAMWGLQGKRGKEEKL